MMRRANLILLSLIVLLGASSLAFAKKKKKKKRSPVLKTKYGTLKIFPADNFWNQDISKFKVHPNSKDYIASMGFDKTLHPDFGSPWKGKPIGIPFIVVSKKQKKVPVTFRYADESDKGPYPIPDTAPIEGGKDAKGDRHVLVIDYHNKKLYELFSAYKTEKGWKAGSGAIFDLTSNKQRRAGWTSADAAGLAIFPGLVRYDEVVQQRVIRHALRFTAQKTQRAYVFPATHFASRHKDAKLPPMGLRVRLKRSFDIRPFPLSVQVILVALKKYGMILADNGSDWYVSGAPNPKWNNNELRALKKLKGGDFEAVYTGPLVTK